MPQSEPLPFIAPRPILQGVQLLTVSDAAKRLALDPETVRRYLRDKAIKGVLVGRYWRIEETELTAYVERLKAAQTK